MLAAILTTYSSLGADILATTAQGTVVGETGVVMPNGGEFLVSIWKGIPFGSDGETNGKAKRWAPLGDAVGYGNGGVLQAKEWPDSCPNKINTLSPLCRTCSTRSNPPYFENSETCLFLNIMAPATIPEGELLPVMLYIHGGGNTIGTGAPYSNSSGLVKHGVLLVTINYRLGQLGFMEHKELSAEQGGVSGNYAVHDMISALQWTKENIKAFGGDATRVTIFGQSAGGTDIQYLLQTPLAANLFHAAIAHSGGGLSTLKTQESQETAIGDALWTKLGCTDLECARKAKWEDVIDSGVSATTAVSHPDGVFPVASFKAAIRAGTTVNRVPAIFGYDLVEPHLGNYFAGRDYSFYEKDYAPAASFASKLKSAIGGSPNETFVARVTAAYPLGPAPLNNNYEIVSNVKTDFAQGFNAWAWAQEWSAVAGARTFVYTGHAGQPGEEPGLAAFGAGHLVDLIPVMDDTWLIDGHEMTEDEKLTSACMSKMWTNFAATTDPTPNPSDWEWKLFDESGTKNWYTMEIGDAGKAESMFDRRAIAYELATELKQYDGPIFGDGGRNLPRGRPGATATVRGPSYASFDQVGWGFSAHGGFPVNPWASYQLNQSTVAYFVGNASGMDSVGEVEAEVKLGYLGIGWQLNNIPSHYSHLEAAEIAQAKVLRAARPDVRIGVLRNTEVATVFWDTAKKVMNDPATQHYWTQCPNATTGGTSPCVGTWASPAGNTPKYFFNFSDPDLQDWWVNTYIGATIANPLFDGVYFDCSCGTPPGVAKGDKQFIADAQATFDRAMLNVLAMGKWVSAWDRSSNLKELSQPNCDASMRAWLAAGVNDTGHTLQISGHAFNKPGNAQAENATVAGFLIARGSSAMIELDVRGAYENMAMYDLPSLLDGDFGVPLGEAKEVRKSVWSREWSKATVELDCNTFASTFVWKKE